MAGIRGHADDWPVLLLIGAILAAIAVSQWRQVQADIQARQGASPSAVASPTAPVVPHAP